MTTKLLPCPFCGAPAEHDSGHFSGIRSPVGKPICGHAIYCSDRGCIGQPGFSLVWPDDEGGYDEAVKAWNTRSPPQPIHDVSGAREVLADAVERSGNATLARHLRSGGDSTVYAATAIRAMEVFANQQPSKGEVERLREALEPFANLGLLLDDPFAPALFRDDQSAGIGGAWSENGETRTVTFGDLKRAAAALNPIPDSGKESA